MDNMISKFNGRAFELFVNAVLRQQAIKNNAEIFFNSPIINFDTSSVQNHTCFDAVAPEGFGDISGIIVFENKFLSSKLKDKHMNLTSNIIKKINAENIVSNVTVVIVTNLDNDIWDIEHFSDNVDVVIWGRDIINKWINEYPIEYITSINYNEPIPTIVNTVSIPEIEIKNKTNIKAVRKTLKSQHNFAFVLGAGVSIDPGAKSWNQMLLSFCEELEKFKLVDDINKLNEKLGGTNLTTAKLCKDLYKNSRDYFWAIHKCLYDNQKDIDMSFCIFQVAKIIENQKKNKNLRILTYNFDEYLENYLDYLNVSYNTIFDENHIQNDNIPIYHVHGFLPKVKSKSNLESRFIRSIYLTEDYNDLYNRPYSWQISSQLSFFRENTCLFVGCSLSDPNIKRLLNITKRVNNPHYAILTNDGMSTKDLISAEHHFLQLGVEIIWVDNYSEITEVLQEINI